MKVVVYEEREIIKKYIFFNKMQHKIDNMMCGFLNGVYVKQKKLIIMSKIDQKKKFARAVVNALNQILQPNVFLI